MQLLLCYDITDDRRRQRLVQVLLDYGERIQESVFWIETEEDLSGRIRDRVRHVIEEGEDNVWIVPLCLGCAKRIQAIGVRPVPELPEFYVL